MATDWSKYILPVGGIILFYYVLKSWGIIETCNPACTQCSKGSTYSQWFGQCESNYSPCGWFHENCCCDCCVNLSLEEMGYTPLSEGELIYLGELVDSV
jgi:hypothetical protein